MLLKRQEVCVINDESTEEEVHKNKKLRLPHDDESKKQEENALKAIIDLNLSQGHNALD